jgi:DNA-directed RNA polymerase specialized sigma24 family protein
MVSLPKASDGGVVAIVDEGTGFEAFVAAHSPRLRRALVAAYGSERGAEALAEALAYAWEHWARVSAMQHPVPYLYRVGQTRTRRRKSRVVFDVPETGVPWVEPALPAALAALSERQRVAVALVFGFGWQLGEVAELFGVRVTTVQNHLERGLARLRVALEVR